MKTSYKIKITSKKTLLLIWAIDEILLEWGKPDYYDTGLLENFEFIYKLPNLKITGYFDSGDEGITVELFDSVTSLYIDHVLLNLSSTESQIREELKEFLIRNLEELG